MEPAEQGDLVRELSRPLAEGRGWMKLVAVMLLAYGALTALTIVGLLIAWVPIWMGVLLWQAAQGVEEARLTGQAEALQRVQLRLKSYFIITGALTLVGLLLWLAMVIFGITTGMHSMGNGVAPVE